MDLVSPPYTYHYVKQLFHKIGQPKDYPAYVSDSPSPTGVKAFYTYLNKEMGSVNRWTHPPNLLPASDENQLLVMVEPSIIPDTEEMEAYIHFMKTGNTI